MNRSNLKWLGRLALILMLVGGLDSLVVWLVPHPRPWIIAISFLLPSLNVFWVMMPAQKEFVREEAASGRGEQD